MLYSVACCGAPSCRMLASPPEFREGTRRRRHEGLQRAGRNGLSHQSSLGRTSVNPCVNRPQAGTGSFAAHDGQSVTVLSLDVFDSVLTRTCGSPAALFLWLGRRLVHRKVITCSPEAFAHARVLADKHVWRREGGLDSKVSVL